MLFSYCIQVLSLNFRFSIDSPSPPRSIAKHHLPQFSNVLWWILISRHFSVGVINIIPSPPQSFLAIVVPRFLKVQLYISRLAISWTVPSATVGAPVAEPPALVFPAFQQIPWFSTPCSASKVKQFPSSVKSWIVKFRITLYKLIIAISCILFLFQLSSAILIVAPFPSISRPSTFAIEIRWFEELFPHI